VETVDRTAASLPGQSGGLEFREIEPLAEEVLGERVPTGGCIAAAERLGGRLVEVSFGQILAGGLGVGRAQLLGIELLGGRVRRDQPVTSAAGAVGGRTAPLGVPVAEDNRGPVADGLV